MSGEREEWDEDSDESSEGQDSLCMILAEEKTRHHDRELQTDPSSGTYNLDIQEIRGGEELERIAVSRNHSGNYRATQTSKRIWYQKTT